MSQQPTASVDIANLALDFLSQDPIVSLLNPASPAADVMARWYDQTRRLLLRKYIFNFARKVATLTPNANAPTHPDFANGYSLPIDLIRILKLGDRLLWGGAIPTAFFDFSGGYLYCDDLTDQGAAAASTTPSLELSYTYDAINVLQFDAAFIDLLAVTLAESTCKKITGKDPSDKLIAKLRNAEVAAAAVAGQEKPPIRVQRSRIRDVRRSGGIFRNNTVLGGGGPGQF